MFDNTEVRDNVNVIQPAERIENVKLVDMGKVKDVDYTAVFLEFEDEHGAKVRHMEFSPTRFEDDSDEDYAKRIKQAISRIAHFTRAYVPEDDWMKINVDDPNNLKIVNKNFLEYCKKSFDAIKASGNQDKPVAIKLIYSFNKKAQKDFIAFPKVPNFISSEVHPMGFSTNTQYDRYTTNAAAAPDKIDADKELEEGSEAFAGADDDLEELDF